MKQHSNRIAIIGGGPAGLRAAEVAVERGASVTLFDAKPSVGRKFLVAGKSGLNLTNSAVTEDFLAQYSGQDFPKEAWREAYKQFDNYHLSDWASDLGVDTFVASGGKVFPFSKKAAPLLRAWVLKLRQAGVKFRMNHKWSDLRHGDQIELDFLFDGSVLTERFDCVIFAMGGGSWPQTGSTGEWVHPLQELGMQITPLESANCGWSCEWTEETRAITEGKPLHNLHVSALGIQLTGELLVTRYGLEGTPLYTLGKHLRGMAAPEIEIDFKPTFSEERLVQKMESARRDFFKEAGLRWKLNATAIAIIRQYYGEFSDAQSLAKVVKACRIPLIEARPIKEAISTAGGVAWAELDENLMLHKMPGVFCAGEMIDWEAPTGGFLIQGCFVSGNVAGKAAADWS